MRLIDADAFKEAIGTDTKIREVLCEIIDTRPTAYDLEKVVTGLEKKDDACGCGKIYVWEAIGIVKKGGME